MAREWGDRWPDDERCPRHAPARIFLRRGSEVWPVAGGVRWRRCLLRPRAPLYQAEGRGG